jgi:GT2 family glycosyltransferase
METHIAPPVVAVIVTCNPGEWFEETLQAFASQDYPELSVLVLDAASDVDPTPRVARVLPGAFVRLLPTNKGFGASANEVLTMVEGASLLLFCHDDVAPDPDAIHILVEESFRSNAGVVAPKLVSWDDPTRLLHVGMAVDKGGAVVDRMEPGEIDHGQHDAVRDVFLVPGGCTLVRSDLFAELGGFDPLIFAMGEDLDLCWRAQVFGARVVVAPGARVRHLEMLASGRRGLPDQLPSDALGASPAVSFLFDTWVGADGAHGGQGADGAGDAHGGQGADGAGDVHGGQGADGGAAADARHDVDGGKEAAPGRDAGVAARAVDRRRRRGPGHGAHGRQPRVTLQALQRRHELYATLKAYGPFHLVRVLPQIALLALAEFVVAFVAGHRDRASVVAQAWRWNFAHRRSLRAGRTVVRAHRRLDDTTVRRLQLHGSARLAAYVRRAVTHGLQAANLGAAHRGLDESLPAPALDGDAESEPSGTTTSEVTAGTAEGPATSTRWLVWLAAALVVVFGTRQLFGSGFPVVGQLLSMPSWTTLVHRFVSGWQPTGVGTTDPATPATGILGLAGMLLFGSMGLLEKIVVLGCIPVGAIGMARLTRPLGTPWARVVSTVIYLAIPVPYDALATAHWDALILYAACPWIVLLLGQASGVGPFDEAVTDEVTVEGERPNLGDAASVPSVVGNGSSVAVPVISRVVHRAASRSARAWRHSLAGSILALGLLDAFVTSLAPSAAVVTLVVALGLALGSVVSQGAAGLRPAGRVAVTASGASVVALLLLAPWSFAVLGGPARWQTLAGLPVAPTSGAGWGELLRLAVGPIGDAALGWAFLAAAALPLLIGARTRLAWAGRAWSIAVVAWAVAWLAGRGGLGPVSIAPQVLLVPAGVGIALSVGLGVAAFQLDLPGYRFGWRQVAAVTAAAAAVVGMLPVLVGSLGGRWDLVPSGYGEATTWMSANKAQGNFRVLWLGDPRVLPGNGWELTPGLAYAVSENGLPDVTGLWPGSTPGKAAAIGNGIRLARSHSTVRLGRLLAPYAVRYVVVVDTLAPSIPGLQTPISHPAPGDLLGALSAQIDLRQIISEGGFDVFLDPSALPLRAVRGAAGAPQSPASAVTGVDPRLTGWHPALFGASGATSVTGRVQAGTVLDAVAPASAWKLTGNHGAVVAASSSFGYAATFHVRRPGTVTVAFVGSWTHGVEIGIETSAWIVVAAALAGRRWWLDWWWGPIGGRGARRRRRGRAPGDTVRSGGSDRPESLLEPGTGQSTGLGTGPGTGAAGPITEVVT